MRELNTEECKRIEQSQWRTIAEKYDLPTDGDPSRMKVGFDDDTLRSVIEKARALDPSHDVVSTSGRLDIGGMALSSLLFSATVVRTRQVPVVKNDFSTGILEIELEHSPVAFEGEGGGSIRISIEATPESHEIQDMSVRTAS